MIKRNTGIDHIRRYVLAGNMAEVTNLCKSELKHKILIKEKDGMYILEHKYYVNNFKVDLGDDTNASIRIGNIKGESIDIMKKTSKDVLEVHDGDIRLQVGKNKLFKANDIYEKNEGLCKTLKDNNGSTRHLLKVYSKQLQRHQNKRLCMEIIVLKYEEKQPEFRMMVKLWEDRNLKRNITFDVQKIKCMKEALEKNLYKEEL